MKHTPHALMRAAVAAMKVGDCIQQTPPEYRQGNTAGLSAVAHIAARQARIVIKTAVHKGVLFIVRVE